MRLVHLAVFVVACSTASKSPIVANQAAAPAVRPPRPASRGLEFRVVDNDSPFMRRFFVHVGHEQDGTPTDPMAISSGIAMGVDAWADPVDNKSHADYYLVAKDRAVIERYVTTLAAKDPSFALPEDREFGYELSGGKWRTYFLERKASLDGSMVASARQALDPDSGYVTVWLDFDPTAAKALAEVTKRIVGKKLAIVFDSTVKSAPVITGEIAGGRASIRMGAVTIGEQESEAQLLVDALTKK